MLNQKLIDEINARISQIFSSGPIHDIEKNIKAMLTSFLNKLDLVTREEFDVQRELLLRSLDRLTELEDKISKLESTKQRSNEPGKNA
ncbi:MAG TPA: accessory factor UbiK family protein [Burkholderiales bacterium]|nr:accessory factor UbiK family protein [Burkholderiales bacterium]